MNVVAAVMTCGFAMIRFSATAAPDTGTGARDLSRHIRFLADFDSPVQMGGMLFPDPVDASGYVEGRYGKGYYFYSQKVEGRRRERNNLILTTDRELTRNFPVKEGSFAMWFRIDPGHPLPTGKDATSGLWSFTRDWKTDWHLQERFFTTRASSRWNEFVNPGYYNKLYVPSNEWQHAVCVWKDGYGAFYLDGRLVAEKKNLYLEPMTNDVRMTFRLGSSGRGVCNLALDDAVLLDVCLTPEEVKKLATSDKSFLEGRRKPLVRPLEFRAFARNETDVKLRFDVWTPGKGMETVERRFDASRHRPGKVVYEWSHAGIPHKTELTVLPTRDRSAFKINCWDGGNDYGFKRLMGFNQLNVRGGSTRTGRIAFRDAVNEGFFVTLRHWNANDWLPADFDWDEVERKVEKDLSFAVGLEAWTSTLINSETYGATPCIKAQTNAVWLAQARAGAGMEPDFRFMYAPDQLDWRRKMKLKRPITGVLGPTNAAMETLRWVTEEGNPFYGVNRASTRAVHRMSPGNVTWTEPVIPPVGPAAGMARSVDSMGEWNYLYSVSETIAEYVSSWGLLRPTGAKHMTTLTCAYWHSGPRVKENPRRPGAKQRNGKPEPFKITQSADEVMIKSMCALGATPVHAFGFFGTWDWRLGGPAGKLYLAGSTNRLDVVGDPGAAEKYGEFMRSKFFAAADLLAGMTNVPARIAYLLPREIYHCGAYGWEVYKCHGRVGAILADLGLPYDVLFDADITADNLSRYKVALLPQAACLSVAHVEACKAAAEKGVLFVTGADACTDFPGGERIKGFRFYSPKAQKSLQPLRDWLTARRAGLRKDLTAFSEGDGETVRTFEKEHGGVRYVMVVNDKRKPNDPGDGVLTMLATNDWYRPYAARQTISTTIRGVKAPAVVYEFGSASKPRSSGDITRDHAPAETAIYCVYPEPLDKPALSVAAAGPRKSVLTVSLRTTGGKPAPGRTVVTVTIRDGGGRVTDESGRYAVERGSVKIPVRFADADDRSKPWSVTVTDLTTGKSSAIAL